MADSTSVVNVDGEVVSVKMETHGPNKLARKDKPDLVMQLAFPSVTGLSAEDDAKRTALTAKVMDFIQERSAGFEVTFSEDSYGASITFEPSRPVKGFAGTESPEGAITAREMREEVLESLAEKVREGLEESKKDPSLLGSKTFDDAAVLASARELLVESAGGWRNIEPARYQIGNDDFNPPAYYELHISADTIMRSSENRPELMAAMNQLFLEANVPAVARRDAIAGSSIIVEIQEGEDYRGALVPLVEKLAKAAGKSSDMNDYPPIDKMGMDEPQVRAKQRQAAR